MSINKAQALALADQFLDDIGSDDKDELQPRETFSELFLLAGELIEDMQENLIAGRNIASGELSESIKANEPTQSGDVISMDVIMNFYGKFLNKGVKGTRSGTSKAGYSFKNEIVSRKMLKAFIRYIGRAKKSTSITRKKPYGSHETKNADLARIDNAYALARSIKMLGIKPRGFLDKAVVTTTRKVQDRLGSAFEIDILNSI